MSMVHTKGGPALAGVSGAAHSSPEFVQIDEDVLALRLPLYCAPGHVNCYLIRGDAGWTIVDPGMFDERTCKTWIDCLAKLPTPSAVSQVIVTHWHPDHVGMAGWLCQMLDVPLLMSDSEYLQACANQYTPRSVQDATEREFFFLHGLDERATQSWVLDGRSFIRSTYDLPTRFRSLDDASSIRIGRRNFEIFICPGHSLGAAVLYDKANGLVVCGDHVTQKGASNIEVQTNQPRANPLFGYFRSLRRLKENRIENSLVLAGHGNTFRDFDLRCDEIRAFHQDKCEQIVTCCGQTEKTATELLGMIYSTYPSPAWIGFQIAQIVAYANCLIALGRIRSAKKNGVIRFVTP